ncbi:hypothetical protein A9Z42_0046050 [Trichoderma parareesei]|uniref:DUF7703 domain-containing protein n=1 Tax=Trichoderma parareesei TaxID=858221 RepID=A0A2H2Z806_TRIPA|nr:hypothetical protein A9Z42_0046050 [Trichoderma parareesei]
MAAGSSSTVVSQGRIHDETTHIVMYVFFSLALYNVGELACHIAVTFKRLRGLYCWSFLVSTAGIALNAVGFLLRAVGHPRLSSYAYTALGIAGWAAMVTGQSLVLYSRLHIVLLRERLVRGILIMIVVNAVWLLVPITVLLFLCNLPPPRAARFQAPYFVFERIQLTVFFVQEVVISALYIRETYRILRSYRGLVGVNRRTMWHVILINLVIIALDVSILVLQYTDHYDLQTAWKPFAYSVKLKMEFSVLNRLVELSQYMHRNRGIALIEAPAARGVPLPPLLMVTAEGGGTAATTTRSGGGGCCQDVSAISTVTRSSVEPKAVQQQQQQQPPRTDASAEASTAASTAGESRIEAPPNVLQLEKSQLQV